MRQADRKSLIWGAHPQEFLPACRVRGTAAEPVPRVARPVPSWYRRLAAALTILGLVGGFRMLDQAVSPPIGAETTGPGWEAAGSKAAYPPGAPPLAEAGSDLLSASATAPSHFFSSSLQHYRAGAPGVRRRTRALVQTAWKPAPTSKPHRFRRVHATGYTSRVCETDDTPFVTASNLPPVVGSLALSRDLLRTFTPEAPFDFGDKVLIPGVGVFEVRDTMNARWTDRADLWFTSLDQALAWGRRTIFLTKVEEDVPTMAAQIQ